MGVGRGPRPRTRASGLPPVDSEKSGVHSELCAAFPGFAQWNQIRFESEFGFLKIGRSGAPGWLNSLSVCLRLRS